MPQRRRTIDNKASTLDILGTPGQWSGRPITEGCFISPIWKGGNRTLPAAYRPVAPTSHLAMLMESMVMVPIVTFLEEQGFMDDTAWSQDRKINHEPTPLTT